MKRCLCVRLPNWPIQRLVVEQPELKRKRILLFRRDSRRGQLVAAASPLALNDGVKIAMPLSEAKSLLQRTTRIPSYRSDARTHPRTQHAHIAREGIAIETSKTTRVHPVAAQESLQAFYIFEHQPICDREALEIFCDGLSEFSPIVGLEQNDRPDSLFLDITGLTHLFGNEQQLAILVMKHCQQLGFHARVAVADTPGMAWAISRFATSIEQPLQRVARQRATGQQVAGQTPASHETPALTSDEETNLQSPEWLDQLPVEALRLSGATTETLYQLGINTIAALRKVPRTDLASRFGTEVHIRFDQFTGTVEEPIVARHRPPEFWAEQFLEFPTNDRETIEVIITRLVQSICQQMQAQQKGALEWTIRLDCPHTPPIEFRVNLFQPTATVTHVVQLAQMQLETALQPHTKSAPAKKAASTTGQTSPRQARKRTRIQIQEVQIGVSNCVLLVERQRLLFDENPRLDKQALAHLINRLTSRLGKERVLFPTLQSGAQPEFAVRYRPLADPHRSPRATKKKTHTQSHVMYRPLRLLNPPAALKATSETCSQPPNTLLVQGVIQPITNSWGPERIETGWWRGPTTRRDYWRVEIENGQQFWIFLDLRKRCWFLHGEF